jgi:AcrR family transcriptional regulator
VSVLSVLPDLPDIASAQDLRRQRILAAARACFSRHGFHGATMGQICAEAAMSPGALYRYFPSKDAIIGAIAEEERVNAGACMAALAGEGSLVDRMTAVAMDYLRGARDPETGGLMVEICSESLRNTAVGERFHEIEREVRDAFRAALVEAQAAGEIAGDLDLDVVLMMVFAIGDGLQMRLALEPDFAVERLETELRRVLAALLGLPRPC